MNAPGLSRRDFNAALAGSLMPAWLAACASGGCSTPAPRFVSDPFALGVASGEPSSDGFVIWTRLVGADLPASAIAVGWEVADDENFTRIVRRGRYTAVAALAHAVHVELRGLRPGRPYWYRFHAGGQTSRVGRSATTDLQPRTLRLALSCCQNWEHGYFSAYRDMLCQNLDLILHVGDYIYERSWGEPPFARGPAGPEARDLAGYRRRHALWRSDPDLQAAHATLPFVVTWDDHEVSNDYAAAYSGVGDSSEVFAQRRAAAYQAYFEHMPLRPSMLAADGSLRLYRRLGWGQLASLHVLDTRQYRDDQACAAPDEQAGRALRDCAALQDPARTLLGPTQESWLRRGLGTERAQWSLIAQQLLFSQLDLQAGAGRSVWSDFWDGYPHCRQRSIAALRQPAVRNALVLGGDIHSYWACDVKDDYDDPDSVTVASELVTTCLASRNPSTGRFGAVRDNNPHVRACDLDGSGYILLDIVAQRVRSELRVVDDLADPASRCTPRHVFVVEDGRPGLQQG